MHIKKKKIWHLLKLKILSGTPPKKETEVHTVMGKI